MGGVRTLFLTHRDDVADHAAFARRFGAERIMHADDGAARLGVERIVRGVEELRLDEDLRVIPTPGHTRGHIVLLYKDRYLFTGDHLAWDRERRRLTAFRDYCWDSWAKQRQSMAKLLDYSFEWVLPGHGQRVQLSAAEMRQQLAALIERMGRQARD